MTDEIEDRLAALLAAPGRAADEAFATRMERLVLAEERLRGAHRAAWLRFGLEMVAGAALIVVFVVLGRLAPGPDSEGIVPLFGPVSAGLLLLALWIGVSWRPESGASGY